MWLRGPLTDADTAWWFEGAVAQARAGYDPVGVFPDKVRAALDALAMSGPGGREAAEAHVRAVFAIEFPRPDTG